ncbi:nonribosomal peptide synthetase lcsA [Trichoderma asperellum]|uniref:Nonribosomal peptide synthetase lcsA n=1 Tax=Trichoderma asperellum TaxID=101201 RepID=A0A6V8QXB2_TRIAP|nr:nonribosomal peptide synthetase lcsA [Trichoderma asperellum]
MNIDPESASKYWTEQLYKAEKASFPPTNASLTNRPQSSKSVRSLVANLDLPDISATGITKATILRAAWAILLARYCDTDDICFGTTISGRQAPVPGIADMPGPTIATVPLRIRLDRQESVHSFLQSVQDRALTMVEFEQYGLQNIRKLSSDALDACDFSSLLVIQPKEALEYAGGREDPILISTEQALETGEYALQNYFNYPLVIQGHLNNESAQLVLIYDSEILHEKQIVAISHQFQHVAKELALGMELNLGTIRVASSWDLQQSEIFNSEMPEAIESCFHTLVEMQAARTPDATAICAWDGSFTYRELDRAANRLAHHLMAEHSVKLDEIIHVCFDKSIWFFVSILAINKAGAAWAPLDPSHPPERLRQIIKQTNAVVALTNGIPGSRIISE